MSFHDKVSHPADLLVKHWEEIGNRNGRAKDLSIDFLPSLDRKIWGLKKRKLVVVAGRPSMGKSTLMLNMAYSFAKQGKTVYFFSLEMTKEECLERLICNYCSIDNIYIHTGQVGGFTEKIAEFHKELSSLKLVIIESWGKNFGELLEVMETYKNPDVILIDYINMIRQGSKNKRDAIGEYIKELRTLALDNNFCAIIGAQMNRDVHKLQLPGKEVPVPNMWNLKEAGELEEHSDQVFIVHWPHFYRFNDGGESNDPQQFIIKVAKNRGGKTGLFIGDFLPQFYRIEERKTESTKYDKGND